MSSSHYEIKGRPDLLQLYPWRPAARLLQQTPAEKRQFGTPAEWVCVCETEIECFCCTCSCACRFCRPEQWSAERVPDLRVWQPTRWGLGKSLRAKTCQQQCTETLNLENTDHHHGHLPMNRLFNRLCSLSVSNASPANTSMGLVPSGHLLFCKRRKKKSEIRFRTCLNMCLNKITKTAKWMYLNVAQRGVLLNSKLNHVEHVKVKQTTCMQSIANTQSSHAGLWT